MPTYNFNALNASSVDAVYSNFSYQAAWLFPLILAFEFFVILIAGIYAQNRRIGFSNVPMWGTIAGLTTTTTAFFLSVISGIIQIDTIGVCLAGTLGFALWFFLTDLD